MVEGGHFESKKSIFGYGRGEGADYGSLQTSWVVGKDLSKYASIFENLDPVDGKISGASAKTVSCQDYFWTKKLSLGHLICDFISSVTNVHIHHIYVIPPTP